MICVIKDLLKSRTMLLTMIFIIGISYVGGLNNRNLSQNIKNNYNIVQEMN